MDKNNSFKEKLLKLIYPNRCPFCDKVIPNQEYACNKCKALLPQYSVTVYANGGYPCAAPLRYTGCFADAVKRFKFNHHTGYSPNLAILTVGAVLERFSAEEIAALDCVACVPMHPVDQRKRRYNQAELLAKDCAALMELPYEALLEKHKRNQVQHTLARSERPQNVRGVYRCVNKEAVRGKRVLLIDDIITTGATLGECARMLKKAGCKSVSCAVVCTVGEAL
ncbi:MAG: phosphoribosyltransferase family protein [Ruminococcus sp.]|nr:phosphoribosyltransferase family protein [Ruminococcus sp.]